MKKFALYILAFILGALLVFFFLKPKSGMASPEASGLLSYQIKKLNKMVVIEEEYNYKQSFKGNVLPDDLLNKFDVLKYLDHKNIVVLAKGTSQVSYDMRKMNIVVDEKQKKIVIKSLPDPEYKLFTDIQYLNLETGVLNSVDAEELNSYKAYVENKIQAMVNKPQLNEKAHKQLIENLSELFVLAKALGWQIEDETSQNISTQVDELINL